MDAIVQLVRNGLCCIKDLDLFADSWIHDPMVLFRIYQPGHPRNRTTPLELAIFFSQLYALVTVTLAGVKLIKQTGWRKLLRAGRVRSFRAQSNDNASLASKIVDESIKNEESAAIRSIFVGVNVAAIGICFFWLCANSLHITMVNWFGGLQGLIHALTVMEIGLLPLLVYMIIDANEMFKKAKRMTDFSALLKKSKGKLSSVGGKDLLNAETYSWIVSGGWSPFWSEGIASYAKKQSTTEEEKEVNEELRKVKTTVERLLATSDSDEKEAKILRRALDDTADRLESEAHVVRMEGYREYLYFVLNFVAFYGYLLGILVFYFDDEETHHHLKSVKFGFSNADADWHGNFAGDLMWTIEPLVILGSPTLMGWLKPKEEKVKSD